MDLTLIFISIIFLIFLIFFGGISINYRDKYNELLTTVKEAEEARAVKEAEEARNVGRTRIPITWDEECKYVYANSTPEEFVHQFGKPWKTETHTFISGKKYLLLCYVSNRDEHLFMHVWFDSNYKLNEIKIS